MAFLDTLYRDLIQAHERDVVKPDLTNYVIVWNDVSFHRVTTVREWFAVHRRKWQSSSFHHTPRPWIQQRNSFQPGGGKYMTVGHGIRCLSWVPWMLHVRVSQVISAGDGCATCIARGNIRCDVDENLWPNQQDRQDVHEDENLSCDVACCEEVRRFVWFCFCFTKLSQVFSLLWMLIVFVFLQGCHFVANFLFTVYDFT